MIGSFPARTGGLALLALRPRAIAAVAALSAAASLLALPVSQAHASATPTITGISPMTAPIGSTLTVQGTGLEDTTSVTLAGTPLSDVTVVDDTQVTATVPAGATSGTLALATLSGGSATSADRITVPPVITGLTGRVGHSGAVLSWTKGGSATAVVRDVTAVTTTPLLVTDGRGIPVAGLSAKDAGFGNTAPARYAVWATDTDGTRSLEPQLVQVDPAVLPTTVTLTSTVTRIPFGRTVVLTGKLTRAGVALPRHTVEIHGYTPRLPRVLLRRLTTTTSGTFRTTFVPKRSTDYSAVFTGNAFSSRSNVAHAVVRVVPRISGRLTRTSIARREATVLLGQAQPPLPRAVVTVQRRAAGRWVTHSRVRTASNGSYRARLAPTAVGRHVFRAVLNSTPGLSQVPTPARAVTVRPRTLVSGTSGDDVLALQRLLTRLRYQPGTHDGRFGYSVQHAVMAFQKVERLPVNGRWGSSERARALRPTAWRLRFPRSGRAVEIDLRRQVLVLSEAGRVKRIVDISSGNNALYTVDGATHRAYTPRGSFRITRKINGIRISRLGALYRPSYFLRGWAIHGSASVPNYPASHGCIRITNPNADRLFPLLRVGTPVSIYRS